MDGRCNRSMPNISEDGGLVRYYAEVSRKDESTEAWVAGILSRDLMPH
jgi:hypothetical protein